jgi:hypothetical protein
MLFRDAAPNWRQAILGTLGLFVVLVAMPSTSHALCSLPQEEGNWINADPSTNSLTRIQLQFVCQDQILNGQPYPPGPPWYVHVWGKCHPSDCDWGRVGANKLSNGQIYAVFNQGFATKHVYAKMSQYRQGQLWVYTYTDFTDADGRTDYATENWFVKNGGLTESARQPVPPPRRGKPKAWPAERH